MQELSAGNKNININKCVDQSDECFMPAKNSHMRMHNKIKTNHDKSSIPDFYRCVFETSFVTQTFKHCIVQCNYYF